MIVVRLNCFLIVFHLLRTIVYLRKSHFVLTLFLPVSTFSSADNLCKQSEPDQTKPFDALIVFMNERFEKVNY